MLHLSGRSFFLLVVAAVSTIVLVPTARADSRRPNVIVILADDLGWGETGFQGCKDIPTPHIDSIAAGGVRFTRGYVSGPYCSPTRAGLMTGRYQTRFGHEFNSVGQTLGLTLDETTMADRLKALGYATCAVGKWHLGNKPTHRPTKRGFDEYYGTLGNTPFFRPTQFVDSRVSDETKPVTDPNFYTTDKYAERSVDWIEKHKGEPFFLYLPLNAQHAPLQAPKKYLDRFADITDPKRKTFAAMMSAADDAVGAILQKVRDIGQEENTLIIYLGDNGGPTLTTTSNNGPLRGYKSMTWEGGIRVPFAFQWKGHVPAGTTYDKPIIQLDILPTVVNAARGTIDPSWKLDGVDLMPYLTGQSEAAPHEALYWRFGPQRAIIQGDWKWVVGREGKPEGELVNLANDIGEKTDLSATQSEKLAELKTKWEAWNAEQAPPSVPAEKPRRRVRRANQQASR